MLIGYARVSTADQNRDLQNDALTKAGCEQIFTDTASGAGDERTGLEQAIALPARGIPSSSGSSIAWGAGSSTSSRRSTPSRRGRSASAACRSRSTRPPAAANSSSTSSAPWPSSNGTWSASGPGRACGRRGLADDKGGGPRALDEKKLALARSLHQDPANTTRSHLCHARDLAGNVLPASPPRGGSPQADGRGEEPVREARRATRRTSSA